jgi:D-galactarolactone cycloisomerase
MKITELQTFVLSDQLDKEFFFSQWAYKERRICLVKITTDTGLHGWGEGYGPADVLEAGIKLLAPLLIGKNPLEQETIWFDLYRKTLDYARRGILVASISAIDVALWDIKGKALNVPVSVLMGGQHRARIQPYATGLYFAQSTNLAKDLANEACGYVSQGFKAIKMKVGLSIEADHANVKAVRAAIGPNIQLMVDANHAYSLQEAARLARLIEPYNIGWFEEPVSPEFYHHYRELRNKTTIPIAGGECEYLRYGFLQLLKNDCVDILQIDICAAGGLTEAKRVSALASSFGVEVVPHTWGTGIAFHAALHFIANLEPLPGRLYPPEFFIEYDRTENDIRETLTTPAITMQDGFIKVPQDPGLGIEVNEEVLRHYSQQIIETTNS